MASQRRTFRHALTSNREETLIGSAFLACLIWRQSGTWGDGDVNRSVDKSCFRPVKEGPLWMGRAMNGI